MSEEDSNVRTAVKLQDEVKKAIGLLSRSGEIRKRVVDKLVEEEIVRLGILLAKALVKRKEQISIIDKIEPDQCGFDLNGDMVAQYWSKDKLQEKQKAIQKLAKIDKAIDLAIDAADYSRIKQVIS